MQYPDWIWHNGAHQALGRSHHARDGARAALRLVGVRRHPQLRRRRTARRSSASPTTTRACSPRRRSTTWRCRTRSSRSTPRAAKCITRQRQHHRLPAPGRVPRPRRLRPVGGHADRRRGRDLEDGPVPGRRRARTGHRRLRVELAALRAEHDSRRRQGRRQLPVRPAGRARGAPPGLRRRHRAGLHRPAQRRRGREPVPGVRRRAAHHAGQRRAAQRHHPQHDHHAWRATPASKWSSATCRANTCTCATSSSCAAPRRKSRRSVRSTAARSAPASPGR